MSNGQPEGEREAGSTRGRKCEREGVWEYGRGYGREYGRKYEREYGREYGREIL